MASEFRYPLPVSAAIVLLIISQLFSLDLNGQSLDTAKVGIDNRGLHVKKTVGWKESNGYYISQFNDFNTLVQVDESFELKNTYPIDKPNLAYSDCFIFANKIFVLYEKKIRGNNIFYLLSIDPKTLLPLDSLVEIAAVSNLREKGVRVSLNQKFALFFLSAKSTDGLYYVKTLMLDSSLKKIREEKFIIESKKYFFITDAYVDEKGDGFIWGLNSLVRLETKITTIFIPLNKKAYKKEIKWLGFYPRNLYSCSTPNHELIICGSYRDSSDEMTNYRFHSVGLFVIHYDQFGVQINTADIAFDSLFFSKYTTTYSNEYAKKFGFSYFKINAAYANSAGSLFILATTAVYSNPGLLPQENHSFLIASSGELIRSFWQPCGLQEDILFYSNPYIIYQTDSSIKLVQLIISDSTKDYTLTEVSRESGFSQKTTQNIPVDYPGLRLKSIDYDPIKRVLHFSWMMVYWPGEIRIISSSDP